MKQLICIVCPKGCHLTVDETDNFKVYGASCEKGAQYGKIELINPTRTITSTVAIKSDLDRLPVKTSQPVAKGKIFQIMAQLKQVKVASPIKAGDVIIKNVCDTGADIIATRSL